MDNAIKRGATIEKRFDRTVDKTYTEEWKKLLKELEPFFRQLRKIESDAERLFPDGGHRADAWKELKRREAVVAYKVEEKIEKALNTARKRCEKDYASGLMMIGSNSLMTELEDVLYEDY